MKRPLRIVKILLIIIGIKHLLMGILRRASVQGLGRGGMASGWHKLVIPGKIRSLGPGPSITVS